MRTPWTVALCLALALPRVAWAAGEIDGIVSPDEYVGKADLGGGLFTLRWSVEGGEVRFAMSARTSGWIALGIDPVDGMKGADVVLAWVDGDGKAHLEDHFSTGRHGPHRLDSDLGGRSDVTRFAGRRQDGLTTVEFARKLSTGDEFDRPVPAAGKLKLIWALGGADPRERHAKRGAAEITIGPSGEGGERVARREHEHGRAGGLALLPFHAALMALGVVLALSAVSVAGLLRKRRWWLKAHRALGAGAAVSVVAGVVVAAVMVGGRHFEGPHTWIGAAALVLAVGTPLGGYLGTRPGMHAKRLRTGHRWAGRLTVAVMMTAAATGLFASGIL